MADYDHRWRNERDRPYGWDEDQDRRSSREPRGRDYREYGRDYGLDENQQMGRQDFARGDYREGYGREDYAQGIYGSGYGEGGFGQGTYGQAYRSDYGRDYNQGNSRERGYTQREARRDFYPTREDIRGYNRNPRDERGFWDRASDEISSWFGDDDAQRRRRTDEREQGQHRGRGPRGYRRSDDRIRDDVSDRLADDAWIDATEIDVSVEKGEVTLSGTVDSRNTRRRAEDVAESVSGVTYVQNNLRIMSRSEAVTGSDTTDNAVSLGTAGKIGQR